MTRLFLLTGFWLGGLFQKAFAQGFGNRQSGGIIPPLINPIGCEDFKCVAERIIDLLIMIAAPLTAILVLIGGFQMITAAGDPAKFGTGKKTILYSAIGFVIVLLAKGVVTLIKNVFS